MKLQKVSTLSNGIRLSLTENDIEVAHAYLYLLANDLHKAPFGFIEDVFVEETHRGKGIGTQLTHELIAEAKKYGCYKLICTSRHAKDKVHALYTKAGFVNHGLEFRMDFK